MVKRIFCMTLLMLLLEQCAGPKSVKNSDNRSGDEPTTEEDANLTVASAKEIFVPVCSRAMDDVSAPPQKPYVVYTYNACGKDKVPSITIGCTRKAVQVNSANLSCTAEGIVAIDGLPVGTGGFKCAAADDSTGTVSGCDASNLVP